MDIFPWAGEDNSHGLYVDVVHPGLGVKARYLHLSYIDRVSGNVVKGRQVGLTGSTGLLTGPHLHFGVFDLQTGWDVNPINFLDGTSAGNLFLQMIYQIIFHHIPIEFR